MSERIPTGIAQMETNSDALLKQEEFSRLTSQAIEQRALSDEVRNYNDAAEVAIFGSYNYPVDFNRVIAPNSPAVAGIVEDIKHNPRYGTKEIDRLDASKQYETDIDGLLNEGFELCQAKLVLDLKAETAGRIYKEHKEATRLKNLYLKLGKSDSEAEAMSAKRVADQTVPLLSNDQIKETIKDGGAFTKEDFERLLNGEHLYDELGNYISDNQVDAIDTTKSKNKGRRRKEDSKVKKVDDRTNLDNDQNEPLDDEDNDQDKDEVDVIEEDNDQSEPLDDEDTKQMLALPAAPTQDEKNRDAQRYSLEEALNEAYETIQYAQLSAIHERSGFINARNPHGKRAADQVAPNMRITDNMVEKARYKLEETRQTNHESMIQKLNDAGTSPDEINKIMKQHDSLFVANIALLQTEERNKLADFSAEGSLGQARVKFYDWWARQGGGGDRFFSRHRLVGTAKKAAVMAAIGVPAGLIGAMVAPLAGGVLGVAGVAAAVRTSSGIARGLASAHLDRKSNITVANAQARRRYQEGVSSINEHYDAYVPGSKVIVPEIVTDSFRDGTLREVQRNKSRTVKAVGMAVLGATAAAGISAAGEHIFNSGGHELGHAAIQHAHKATGIHPKGNTLKGSTTKNSVPKSNAQAPSHTGAIVSGNKTFEVNSGNGIIDEINKYATAHGKTINGSQAEQIYQHLAAHNGKNIIKLNGNGPSEYTISSGNYGLSHPGLGRWYPGVEAEMDKLLNQTKS